MKKVLAYFKMPSLMAEKNTHQELHVIDVPANVTVKLIYHPLVITKLFYMTV